jgi:hypothetical protein
MQASRPYRLIFGTQRVQRPPTEARAASRERDNLLSDLRFRRLIADADWERLPPAVRRRFTQRLAGGNTIVYTGEVTETRLSRAGWWLAQAARLIGAPLPLSAEARVPSVVTVTEDMAKGGQVWTRLYARRSGFPQVIHSAKRFAGSTGLEEYVGHGIGMALTVHVVDLGRERPEGSPSTDTPVRDDKSKIAHPALVFRSARYFLQVFGLRIPLPRWLTPGDLSVTHAEIGEGAFAYTLDVVHPRLGLLVRQTATFRETVSCIPPSYG